MCYISSSFDLSILSFVLDDSSLAFWNFSVIRSLNDGAKTGSWALFWCSPGVFLIPFKPACRLRHRSECTGLGLMPVGLFRVAQCVRSLGLLLCQEP